MRTRMLAAVVASIMLVVGLTAAAFASRAKTPTAQPQTLIFVLVPTASGSIDADPPGPSVGDQQTSSNNLMQNARKVGTIDSNCALALPRLICWAVLQLQPGQITLSGEVRKAVLQGHAVLIRLAVTGGTGAYGGVRGVAVIDRTPSGKQRLTITLMS